MRLLYYPYNSERNACNKYFKEAFISLGVELIPLDKNVVRQILCKADGVFLQWYENLPTQMPKAIVLAMLKALMVVVSKLLGRTIYFVMHNKVAHDKEIRSISMFLVKFILHRADKIIILSHTSKQEILNIVGEKKFIKYNLNDRICFVPHPNYITAYPSDKSCEYQRESLGIEDNDFVFLFMGLVRPYKNVDVLIKAFKEAKMPNAKLIIAGNPQPASYKEILNGIIAESRNIIPLFKFISNGAIESLMRISDVCVLPFDIENSLNSGSVYLSFSFKKTVIAPPIATIHNFDDYRDKMFIYEYSIPESHIKALKEALNHCYEKHIDNRKELKEKGNFMYEVVREQNSFAKLTESFSKVIGYGI
jgi:glycosyltransferase involved in cell wall biosynthesis